jgi:hypothetical protein
MYFRASFSTSEPMVKSAYEPESIHREPPQREYAGKPYFASSQRSAGFSCGDSLIGRPVKNDCCALPPIRAASQFSCILE